MAKPLDRPLRIGTRGSPLALAQARMAADALLAAHGWSADAVEIVPITTTGDVIQNRPLAEVGGKALWTKELDRALGEGDTDLSVHSMKDVETIRADALVIGAMLPRADTRDRLVGAGTIADIPRGARVGTSSPRRTAQLLARRPDLEIVPIRGNVQTRLARLERGEVAASRLAAAGLDGIGLGIVGTPVDMLPAPAQGAIGIEARADDAEARALVAAIDDRATHLCVAAERAFLKAIGGDCRSAVAARARMAPDGRVLLVAEILSPDGREHQAGEILCKAGDEIGPTALAAEILARAGAGLRAMFAA
jgi:hydroxymethylbilane synthase